VSFKRLRRQSKRLSKVSAKMPIVSNLQYYINRLLTDKIIFFIFFPNHVARMLINLVLWDRLKQFAGLTIRETRYLATGAGDERVMYQCN